MSTPGSGVHRTMDTSWASWFCETIFGSNPNESMRVFDGDYDDRMADEINFMELRDGKRLSTLPSERGDRQSEFDDCASTISTRSNLPEFIQEEIAGMSTPNSEGHLGGTAGPFHETAPTCSDTGFSTPGGRRYLSFADCQQLPKTDYMYAYTPVYSPNMYRTRNMEMPNMCRQPIRSSATGSSSVSATDYSLRSRKTSTTSAKIVGSIPLFGTDELDDNASTTSSRISSTSNARRQPPQPSRISMFCSNVRHRFVNSLNLIFAFFLFSFCRAPCALAVSTSQKVSALSKWLFKCLVFCITRPLSIVASIVSSTSSAAASAAGSTASSASTAALGCLETTINTGTTLIQHSSTIVTYFWMTVRKTISNTTAMAATASVKAISSFIRYLWLILLIVCLILLLVFFPFGTMYQQASIAYDEIYAMKYFQSIKHWKMPEIPAFSLPSLEFSAATIPPANDATQHIPALDCPDCWKPYAEKIEKMLAERDREIFSKLDSKLSQSASMAIENSETKASAAVERLSVLEKAIAQLKQAIADARAEAKKAIDEADSLRVNARQEDRVAVQQVVDEMWARVDAKLTANTETFERNLIEQQSAVVEKIDAAVRKLHDDVREAVEQAQHDASEAKETAKKAVDAVASLPPPPPATEPVPQQPVVVECKTACPPAPMATTGEGGISQSQVISIVNEAITRYDADRTGQPDFALESSGGSVVNVRCSKTYDVSAGTVSIFGFPVYFDTKSPRTAIQAGPLVPGNCWAFSGSRGFLVVRLSYRVFISSVSLEHIPKQLAPLGRLDSAPRDFSVYALENESDTVGRLLGNFTYDAVNGGALQNFNTFDPTSDHSEAVQYVELRVLSNHGHPNYTCIYRFRVHGQPADTSTPNSHYP